MLKTRGFVFVFIALIIIVLSLGAVGCGSKQEADISQNGQDKDTGKPKDKVIVTLDWTPNTNHTGLYAAKDMGYYEAEGIDVEIVQLSGSTVEQLVATGKSHFGVSYQEAVTYARLSDIPVVSIAAVIQHNTSGFASLKSKGIATPKDFEGKRYGGWGSPVEEATIKALMEKYNADFSKVQILTTGAADFFVTSEKNADFSWTFFGWDGVAAEIKGVELNYIELGKVDPALDYYTPVLIAGEALIKDNPDLVKRFMRATTKGYEYAIEKPEEAANILLVNAPELEEDLVVASQIWLRDKYQAEAEVWGIQNKEVWENYSEWLFKNGLIEAKPDIDRAFTNEFINK